MNNTLPYQPATIAKAFYEHIHTSALELKNTDAESVLEFLYTAYAEVQDRDPEAIDLGFKELDKHLSKFSFEENNEVFCIVCNLCDAYEKRACMDAVQIGAYLMLEVQAN